MIQTDVRPQYQAFIKDRAHLNNNEIRSQVTVLPTQANDEVETFLPSIAHLCCITSEVRDGQHEAKSALQRELPSQIVNLKLKNERTTHPLAFDTFTTILGASAAEVDSVNNVRAVNFQGNLQDGIFSVDLQQIVGSKDTLGVLFFDMTHDQDGSNVLLFKGDPSKTGPVKVSGDFAVEPGISSILNNEFGHQHVALMTDPRILDLHLLISRGLDPGWKDAAANLGPDWKEEITTAGNGCRVFGIQNPQEPAGSRQQVYCDPVNRTTTLFSDAVDQFTASRLQTIVMEGNGDCRRLK